MRHPDKGEIFCSSIHVKEAVKRTGLERTIGPAVEATNILGVNWTFRGRAAPRDATKKGEVARRRLQRIPLGTKSRRKRKRVVQQQLVMPIYTFSGGISRPRINLVRKWRTSIERAVRGGAIPPERSLYLSSQPDIGTELDSEFRMDYEALQLEKFRVRQVAIGAQQASFAAADAKTRWREVAKKWNWTQVAPGVYDTEDGRMELGWEGPVILKKVAQQAHRRFMLKSEPRAKDPESVAVLALHDDMLTPVGSTSRGSARSERRRI